MLWAEVMNPSELRESVITLNPLPKMVEDLQILWIEAELCWPNW
jgi:hypothetical protein